MIAKGTLKAQIESEDGNVTITFRKEKARDAKKLDIDLQSMPNNTDAEKIAKINTQADRIFNNIVTIEGLVDEAGNLVTALQILNGDTYDDIQAAIITAYYRARLEQLKKGQQEKKDSTNES